MKILLTGVTGYIGKRLLPVLIGHGHHIVCCVRDKRRFSVSREWVNQIDIIEVDFLKVETLQSIPDNFDAAYYLIHSMSGSDKSFDKLEALSANNFVDTFRKKSVKQVIYLSGIVNESKLSKHLESRKQVEKILSSGNFPLTTLRAGIIVGSGSASFEIIRDLVEKLPIMVTPSWLNTKSQPIAVRDVISFLTGVLRNKKTFNKSYDIGGPDVLTYKQMLLSYANVRGLKRHIFIVPVMTPRLSSYWLYFVTATSYHLAVNLVNSMKIEVICKPNSLSKMLNIVPLPYNDSISLAFKKIEQNEITSSWKDAMASGVLKDGLSAAITVPTHGCMKEIRKKKITDREKTIDNIWKIGGENGWYQGNWLWELRGFLDKLLGGVGLRRGRTSPDKLHPGDALDFWRVLLADKKQKRLLLYAEMKLPGEAWLEFAIDEKNILTQTATFRPKGLMGRLYWYSIFPFHTYIFKGMLNKIAD